MDAIIMLLWRREHVHRIFEINKQKHFLGSLFRLAKCLFLVRAQKKFINFNFQFSFQSEISSFLLIIIIITIIITIIIIIITIIIMMIWAEINMVLFLLKTQIHKIVLKKPNKWIKEFFVFSHVVGNSCLTSNCPPGDLKK